MNPDFAIVLAFGSIRFFKRSKDGVWQEKSAFDIEGLSEVEVAAQAAHHLPLWNEQSSKVNCWLPFEVFDVQNAAQPVPPETMEVDFQTGENYLIVEQPIETGLQYFVGLEQDILQACAFLEAFEFEVTGLAIVRDAKSADPFPIEISKLQRYSPAISIEGETENDTTRISDPMTAPQDRASTARIAAPKKSPKSSQSHHKKVVLAASVLFAMLFGAAGYIWFSPQQEASDQIVSQAEDLAGSPENLVNLAPTRNPHEGGEASVEVEQIAENADTNIAPNLEQSPTVDPQDNNATEPEGADESQAENTQDQDVAEADEALAEDWQIVGFDAKTRPQDHAAQIAARPEVIEGAPDFNALNRPTDHAEVIALLNAPKIIAPPTRVAGQLKTTIPARATASTQTTTPEATASPAPVAEARPAPPPPSSGDVSQVATIKDVFSYDGLSVLGIYGSSSRPSALMRAASGRVINVRAGDSADGWRIEAIARDQVVISKGSQRLALKVPG